MRDVHCANWMAESSFICVAIDGPAAVGKSSSARGLASLLNFLYVDTGRHYRSVTLACIRKGIAHDDAQGIASFIKKARFETLHERNRAFLSIDGRIDEDEEVKAAQVSQVVSAYASVRAIRERLLPYQRSLVGYAKAAGFDGIVMEGRDIGSVVLPDAQKRFFLRADAAVREKRRAQEGIGDNIQLRDQADQGRTAAPLTCPEGAIVVDTGPLSLEGVIQLMADEVQRISATKAL